LGPFKGAKSGQKRNLEKQKNGEDGLTKDNALHFVFLFPPTPTPPPTPPHKNAKGGGQKVSPYKELQKGSGGEKKDLFCVFCDNIPPFPGWKQALFLLVVTPED